MGRRQVNDGVVSLLVVLVAGGALCWWQSQRPAGARPVAAAPTASVGPTLKTPGAAPSPVVAAGVYAVQWVSDGDTIAIGDAKGQRLAKVRLLGLNAPELAHNGVAAECFGPEAREQLRKLLQGKQVRLVDDSRAPKRDRFGRRLAYVEVGGKDVSTLMIHGGWAVEFHLPSAGPGDRTEVYARAEDEAARARRGLWKACSTGPTAD